MFGLRLSYLVGVPLGVALAFCVVVQAFGQVDSSEHVVRQRPSSPLGQVIDSVKSRADPEQSYALYLPTEYSRARPAPLLLVMDPEGRARFALRRLVEGAERFGYVVMSSYNTASGSGPGPNEEAIDAMIADAQEFLEIDDRRLYLAGLASTARMSWDFGLRLSGHVAGVLGVGAGLPRDRLLVEAVARSFEPFVYFGAAGDVDFAYEEVRSLDAQLDDVELAHRVRYFTGAHGWPTAEVLVEALEWFELQAMRSGRLDMDQDWVSRAAERRFAELRNLEKSGDLLSVVHGYRQIVSDFDGLVDVEEASAREDMLKLNFDVERRIGVLERLSSEDAEFRARLRRYFERLRNGDDPDPDRAIAEFRLDSLRIQARTAEGDEALAAQRILERVFVFKAGFGPRWYLRGGDTEGAWALLQIARAAKPSDAALCYGRAWVHAQAGRLDLAMESLECAARHGAVTARALSREPLLEPLRYQEAFRELLDRMQRGSLGTSHRTNPTFSAPSGRWPSE